MEVRLQKHIADLGICSRRRAEELIEDGKVFLNDEQVTEQGLKVDPEKDIVVVKGFEASNATSEKVYVMLNKPIDYICSSTNEQGASVLDLITTKNVVSSKYSEQAKGIEDVRLYSVGRLDKDSEGLVLLTNDGELTNQLTHPKFGHEKEYEVLIDKPLDKPSIKILQKGMFIEEGVFVRGITIKKTFNKGKRSIITVVLREGKNRQIRKMFGLLGYRVFSLKRTRINRLNIGTLPVGRWKFIRKGDII